MEPLNKTSVISNSLIKKWYSIISSLQLKNSIKFFDRRGIVTLLSLILLLLPVFFIVKIGLNSIQDQEYLWYHLYNTLLPTYLINTFVLTLGVAALSLLFGITSAWMITFYNFPSRKYLVWMLFLPFAFPAYLIAFVYSDFLEFGGPVQTWWRAWLGITPGTAYFFPEFRSMGGAILFMALVYYPYVYMFARKGFLEQSTVIQNAAKIFGLNSFALFFKVSWPLIRPAISVGIFLVMMETIADFGVVSYFSISTLTLGAYNFWINMGSLEGAIQIALITLSVVMVVMFFEKWQRSKKRHYEQHSQPLIRKPTRGFALLGMLMFNWLLVGLGFIFPLSILAYNAIRLLSNNGIEENISDYVIHSWNSLSLAAGTATFTVLAALLIIKLTAFHHSRLVKATLPVFSVGYALPGTILGIGIIPVVMGLNTLIGNWIFLGGTLFAISYAYVIRFISIPLGSIESGHKKISENIYLSSKIFGKSRWSTLFQVDLPLLKNCLLTGFVIVFVDVMKELPLMIILRPLNYETLVTHVFSYASVENLSQASLSAITIVLLGVIPIMFLTQTIDEARISHIPVDSNTNTLTS